MNKMKVKVSTKNSNNTKLQETKKLLLDEHEKEESIAIINLEYSSSII